MLNLTTRLTTKKGSNAVSERTAVYSGAGITVPPSFFCTTFITPWELFGASKYTTATFNTSTSVVTISGNNGRLARTAYCVFSTTGTLPAPLVANQKYYMVNKGPGTVQASWTTFQVSDIPNGPVIALQSSGTGSHTVALGTEDDTAVCNMTRTLDSSCGSWATVNTANGVYNWQSTDDYILYHYGKGREILYTLYQTPTWAAPNTVLDGYGYAGGGGVPTDLTYASTFITALLSRYNAVSPVNPNGNKMIKIVELWNEPSFSPVGTVGGSWCGTHSELATQSRNVYNAVKAVDSSCLVISPGFTSGAASTVAPTSAIYKYLVASAGVGVGKDYVDGVAYHGYGLGSSRHNLANLFEVIRNLSSILSLAGAPSLPLYQSERGIDFADEAIMAIRSAVIEAALGVKLSCHYTYHGFAVPMKSSGTLLYWYNKLNVELAGATITHCAINTDFSVTVVANTGTFVI